MVTNESENISESSGKKDYAARFSVLYPDGRLNRLQAALRLFMVIPIAIILSFLSSGVYLAFPEFDTFADLDFSDYWNAIVLGSGIPIATALMIIFRYKYPRWWFDFQLELARFSSRVTVYFSLMTEKYPSTDEQQDVMLDIDYPDAQKDLNRLLPIVKWLLAIPHYVVLAVLSIFALIAVIFSWFAIIITGKYPSRDIFEFLEGVQRYFWRVNAYTTLLVTDEYPPFSLK